MTSRSPRRHKLLMGWFGVRGIGSLYYLMYAIEHGIPESLALELIHITLIVITLSILLHGLSVKPLFAKHNPPNKLVRHISSRATWLVSS